MDSALNSTPARHRRALAITALAPLFPQVIGSIFNIWYNVSVINPLLATEALRARFAHTVIGYNTLIYPLAVAIWLRVVFSLRPAFRTLSTGGILPLDEMNRVRRRVIHLPWWGALASAVGWLLCIPVFLTALSLHSDRFDPLLYWHFPISIGVSAIMAITHSFFLVELASHSQLFPVFFREERADRVPGAKAITLRWRGVLWAVSASVCPIGSLLLLSFAPPAPGTHPQWFAAFVGFIGISFGLVTAGLMSQLVARPIDHLRTAAQAVAQSRYDIPRPDPRPDEFGTLIAEFHEMTASLKEKEHLRQTFGLHAGRAAAEQILARDPGLGGVEQVVTAMFVDIRSFTARTAASNAPDIVRDLNDFLRAMVAVVEENHGGMINKFLGDGFMALFGVDGTANHASHALAAAQEMLVELDTLNATLSQQGRHPFRIGIGLHTGTAIVGSIGSPQRLEFTAIGNTINVAARTEQLTKTLSVSLLLTDATRSSLESTIDLHELPPQSVRGIEGQIRVFTLPILNS